MIKTGVGLSNHRDMELAAKEASTRALDGLGQSRPDLIVCFATTGFAFYYKKLQEAIHAHTGTSSIVGCSAMAVITGEGEFEGSAGLALLAIASDELEARPFFAEDVPSAVKAISGVSSGTESAGRLLLMLTDIFKVDPLALLEECHKEMGHLPTVGAAASGHPSDKMTAQWAGDRETKFGVAGVLLSGPIVHSTRVSQGCEPIHEPYVITKATGRVIKEIGNRPAYQMLRQALSVFPEAEMERTSRGVFAGILYNEHKYPPGRGDYLMRTIESVDPQEGTVTLLQEAREGQTLQFQVKNPVTAVEELNTGVREIAWERMRDTPLFALYFESVGRGARLHSEPDHDVNIIRQGLGDVPIIGFLSNAEFSPREGRNQMHTYSSALTLVCRRSGG